MKISLLLLLCAAALQSTSVFAEEGIPLSGKIKELEARARTAKEEGRADEAHELMEKAQRLHAQLGERKAQPNGGEKIEMAKRRIDELRKAGKHEEAEQLDQQVRAAGKKHGEPKPKEGASGLERTQHAKEAIQHLHAAGLHELAERVEHVLREQREKTEPRGTEGGILKDGQEQIRQAMREMQEQTQRAVKEMQEQTQRALRDAHEQIARMARNIEELREQAEKQRGDSERRKD